MPRVRVPCALAFVYLVSLIALAPQAGAVTFAQVDDFESGTTASWGGAPTTNVADAGPGGAGDHALEVGKQRPVRIAEHLIHTGGQEDDFVVLRVVAGGHRRLVPRVAYSA